MIIRSTAKADAVLAIIEAELPDDVILALEPYQNMGDHGWALISKPHNDYHLRQVSFSRYENSDYEDTDDIVVYSGSDDQFDWKGNIPEESVHNHPHLFGPSLGNAQYGTAAHYIIDFLTGKTTD